MESQKSRIRLTGLRWLYTDVVPFKSFIYTRNASHRGDTCHAHSDQSKIHRDKRLSDCNYSGKMPPRFRITRSTVQPKVTIYSSPGDLISHGAAVSEGGDPAMDVLTVDRQDSGSALAVVALPGEQVQQPSTPGSSRVTVRSHPDLEDLVAPPTTYTPSTQPTGLASLPVTPDGPAQMQTSYTSLRRTTRSATRPTPPSAPLIKVEEDESLISLAGIADPPVTPTRPRKRVKREPVTPIDQKVKVEGGLDTPGSQPRSAKKVMPLPKLEKPHPAPARWEEQYRLIERMRKGIVAPVDDM